MSNPLCEYGCGREGQHQFDNGRWCCDTHIMRCQAKREERKILSSGSNNPMYGKNHKQDSIKKMQKPHYGIRGDNHPNRRPEAKERLRKNFNHSYVISFMDRDNQRKVASEMFKEMNKDPEFTRKRIIGTIKANKDPERREKQRQRMLDGLAAYIASFVKNPSKPQVELFKLCQEILPYPILNYPSILTNHSIDIAIPQLGIAIEYDGSYWHQNGEKDRIRQESLEEIGWLFIRYVDKVPTKQELLTDVNIMLGSYL